MTCIKPITVVFVLLYFNSVFAQKADSLFNFITQNKDRSSLCIIRNDSIVAKLNDNKMMPLASTMKIMVAVEFAKQATFHVFDTAQLISLKELNKYYLPLTDGDAHPRWIEYERKWNHIRNDSIALIHVARGMILFSSNANTEYLMDLLGLQNINSNYGLMGIKAFTPLYYTVSSLFLYQNPKKLKQEKILKEITALSDHDYTVGCSFIHEQLKNDPTYKSRFNISDLTIPMQRAWSDRLPASTTNAYSHIGNILNNRKIFSPQTYLILSRILESLMENPNNQQWLAHAGMKGGSTMFVVTKSLYATLKGGNRIELSYFFNDLTSAESLKIPNWVNDFELRVLTDPNFIERLAML